MSGTVVPEAVEAIAALRAAFDRFAATDLDTLTLPELLGVADEYEALSCQLPAPAHHLLTALQRTTTPVAMGAKNWKQVLATRWRISTGEAHRRLAAATELGPRTAVTGAPLPPQLPAVAAGQAHGYLNTDLVKTLRDAVHALPHWIDAPTRARFETDLVRVALDAGPEALHAEAARRLTLIDQDGPEPDDRDRDRDRARGVSTGPQRRNGNTPIRVEASPALAAAWEAFFAKFAAPGMCNPDDDAPCTTGTPSQAQIDADHRSSAQRRHDALEVMARIALSTDLGMLNGLPVSVIVTTTLQDLQSRAGVGVSGGGTRIPVPDLIRMGAHAHWALAVFDGVTGAALNLYRSRRVASPAQRLMLIARDRGCTKPGCPVGPYGCQVHHATADWNAGGNPNLDDLALACGPDNRMVGSDERHWRTEVIDGVVHWYPPAHLDTGQATVNHRNRPEQIPLPDEHAPLPWDTPSPAEPEQPPKREPWDGLTPLFDSTPTPRPARPIHWDPDTPPFPDWLEPLTPLIPPVRPTRALPTWLTDDGPPETATEPEHDDDTAPAAAPTEHDDTPPFSARLDCEPAGEPEDNTREPEAHDPPTAPTITTVASPESRREDDDTPPFSARLDREPAGDAGEPNTHDPPNHHAA